MKHVTFLFLVFFMLDLKGQLHGDPNLETSRVQIGVNASVDLSYRMLRKENSSNSDFIINFRNENEVPIISYTSGLNVLFNLKNNLGIEAGIHYSNKGYQSKIMEMFFIPSDPEADDPLIPDSPSDVKFRYDYHYIDIPLRVNFIFGQNKFRLLTSAGITTNVFIKETQTSYLINSGETQKQTQTTDIEYNRFNLSPTVSIGLDYKINNRMNLRIEPIFRYGVLKIIDAPITGYLYNGGINVGYYFGF